MKLGLLVSVALLLGALFGHFLLADNGYVLISFRGYALEMSVPVLVLLLVLGYLAVRILIGIWRAPRRLGERLAGMRDRQAGRQATKGYIALVEGRLTRGERLLTRSARRSDAPLLNYLAAARAAQLQGDRERRNSWLRLARESEPAATDAVLLTQAQMLVEDADYPAALASLKKVREQHPDNAEALRLLAEIHVRQQNWAELADLLPLLRRRSNVSAALLDEWTIRSGAARMHAATVDRAGLDRLWDEIPRPLRRKPQLVAARARALLRLGASDVAEAELRRTLRDHWDGELIALYGSLRPADPAEHLKRIEAWLADRPEDPELLLAAGRASIHHQLWGKARGYLESSLARRPAPETYQELGRLMLSVGDTGEAGEVFRNGLALSCADPGSLPGPAAGTR